MHLISELTNNPDLAMIEKCLNRILQMDQLIRQKATGTPRELASKIGLSERMIYEYLDLMKQWGAEIRFCKEHQSYLYINNVKFKYGYETIKK